MNSWAEIEREIAGTTGSDFRIDGKQSVAGGCINRAWLVEGAGERYFVKLNAPDRAAMFDAEAAGLDELRNANAVRAPRPICNGADSQASWIVLEHVELHPRSGQTDAALGAQLAALHRHTSARYGWHRDDTIGATLQPNTQSDDWPSFWRDRRLGFQLRLARDNGHDGRLRSAGEKLLERVGDFFRGYTPRASLLHGDLWSGNAASDSNGHPVIFDPAVYYGDREADVAMTELFGGFSTSFYEAYDAAYPLDPGYAVRKSLYNLYHVLNHLNLFGGGYRAQAERMIAALVAAVRY